MLAARARGLGTAWTTLHLRYEEEAADLLGIPYSDVRQAALSRSPTRRERISGQQLGSPSRISPTGTRGRAVLGLAARLEREQRAVTADRADVALSPVIRLLGAGDEPTLVQLALDAPDFDLAGRSAPDRPLAAAAAAAYLADPAVLHWVAEDGDRVVGELLCHLLRLPSGEGAELLLYSIGVRESHRRQGVGRGLVQAMRGWMSRCAVSEVWVLADNSGAEAFYAACGFTHGGPHEQGVLMLLNAADTDG